ncbi:hypothetical protein QYM36_012279 [Artemia franciscana]|uniref:Reverse transcriptase domain-containing protein n=1 Tax=Artemia franciscana TaxID=6661 RepID=A0AA88HGT2_ARTSF|nr:hypothetical protein QYM36_012279 [Artemia franciscana]
MWRSLRDGFMREKRSQMLPKSESAGVKDKNPANGTVQWFFLGEHVSTRPTQSNFEVTIQAPVSVINMDEMYSVSAPMSYSQFQTPQLGQWQPQQQVMRMPITNPNGQLSASAYKIRGYNLPVNNRFQVLDNNNDFPSLPAELDEDMGIINPILAEGIMDNSQNEHIRFPNLGLNSSLEEDALAAVKAKRLSKFGNKSLYNKLFIKKQLDNVVANLQNTATGPDMIFPQFVKALPEKWMNVLLEVINVAWDSGVYHTASCFGETFLKEWWLNWEIEKSHVLKDIQCDFRKKSTIEHLLCLKQDALYALQNGLVMVVVDLDVDGAFDSVVHRQILNGVMETGIKGRLLAFTYSYLQGRKVTVKVGGTVSNIFVKRRRGDRQGIVLGPDYYNIAEFDISIQEGGSKWMIFADDNSL